MSEYQKYPVVMIHPHFRRAQRIAVPGTERMVSGVLTPDYQATPELLPPVTACNEDEEEYYLSRGYVLGGKGDPAAYSKATDSAATPDSYVPERYPMWVGATLVNNAAEEAEALGQEPEDARAPAPLLPVLAPAGEVPHASPDPALLNEIEELKAKLAALTQPKQPDLTRSEKAKAAWARRKAMADA